MSDHNDNDVKLPDIHPNRNETGGVSSTVNALGRNESFHSTGGRGRSQPVGGGGVDKSAFLAKKERVEYVKLSQLIY